MIGLLCFVLAVLAWPFRSKLRLEPVETIACSFAICASRKSLATISAFTASRASPPQAATAWLAAASRSSATGVFGSTEVGLLQCSKGYSVEPHRLKDIDNAPGDLIPALQNFLTVAIFPNGSACHGTIDGCACCVEWCHGD